MSQQEEPTRVPYELYYNDTPDEAHPSLFLKEENNSISMHTKKPIETQTIILISPVQLAIRLAGNYNKKERDYGYTTMTFCEAIVHLMIEFGLGNPKSKNYSSSLNDLFLKLHPRTPDNMTIEKAIEKVQRNSFVGHFWEICLMKVGNFINSSCVPNATIIFDEKHQKWVLSTTFITLRELEENEEIKINYALWPIDDDEVRRKRNEDHGFICNCISCNNDSDRSDRSDDSDRSGRSDLSDDSEDKDRSDNNIANKPSVLTSKLPYLSIPNSKHCWLCGKMEKEIQKCSKCKTSWYCNMECQKANWSVHKTICATLKNKKMLKDNHKGFRLNQTVNLVERKSLEDFYL